MAGITATPQLLSALLTPATSVAMGADIALAPANLLTPPIAAPLVSSSIARAPVLEAVAIVASVEDAAAAMVAHATPAETPHPQESSLPAEIPHVVRSHEDRIEIAADTAGAIIWTFEPSQTVPTILLPEAPALTSTRIDPFVTETYQTTAAIIADRVCERPFARGQRQAQPTRGQKADSKSAPVEARVCMSKRTMRSERQTCPAISTSRRASRGIDQRKAAMNVFRPPRMPSSIGGKKSDGTRLVSRYGSPPQTTFKNKSGDRPLLKATARSVPTKIAFFNRKHIDAGAHIIIETHFGTTSIRKYFIDRGGELVFAGWESGAYSSENLATVASPSWDAISAARPSLFAFGLPGGETAFKQEYIAYDNARIGAELAARIIAQLKGGPASLENSLQLAMFNLYLRPSSVRLTDNDWKALVSKTLGLAVQSVPAIDDAGARDISSIISDAADLFAIEAGTFATWQEYFGVELARAQGGTISTGIMGRLIDALASHIGMLAKKMFVIPAYEFASGDEISLQWEVARSGLSGNIKVASDYLFALAGKGERSRACIALALIIKNSALNEIGAREGAMIPRWSAGEITALMKAVTESKYWDIASHRAFRGRLTPNENAAVNLAISTSAGDPFESLRTIDVTKVSEDVFWSAVEASGQADAITFKALLKMGIIAAGQHKGAATRGVYSHSNSAL